jgi:hypothetical protein
VDMNVEGFLPVFFGEFQKASGDGAAGGVNENVQPSECSFGFLDAASATFCCINISLKEDKSSASEFYGGLQFFERIFSAIAPDNGNMRATAG